MNKLIHALLILCSIFITTASASQDDLKYKIAQLDEASRNILGISMRAVSELIQLETTPHFMPVQYLKENGKFQYLEELENNGYILMKYTQGMPNGKRMDEEFVWLVQSELGAYFEQCFVAEPHNKSLNLDAKR